MTSPAGQQAYYEITVKREPNGVFSGWLHDRITAESVVRASRPVGEYYLPLDAHAPAVCLAGGIGVTPALAMVRSLDQLTALSALHLDYSALRAEELVCANELRESAGREERLRVDLRATQAQGQLRRDHVDRLVRQYPGASFYLCGPKPFEDAVRGHLAACGVPQERIRIERFAPCWPPLWLRRSSCFPLSHSRPACGPVSASSSYGPRTPGSRAAVSPRWH